MPLFALVAGVLVLMVATDGVEATHYRYGTLSWEATGNGNEVEFTGAQAWRHSFFSNPPLGSTVTVGAIETGDGGSVPLNVEVVNINALNDWFFGVFVDQQGNEGIKYTYAAPNDNGEPWEASWSSCCRISPRQAGNYHVNNPDQPMTLIAQVDLAAADNNARTNLPPINNCRLNHVCEIETHFIGVDEQDLSFRLSTPTEAGSPSYVPPGPPHADNLVQIDPSTGLITWDLTDPVTHDSDWDNWNTLYSIQVMLETDFTTTPLDFFIRIIPEDAEIPYWDNPEPICGTKQELFSFDTFSFDVTARSDDLDRVITLDHLGLPSGASFPLPTPDNPVTGSFTWTPVSGQAGEYLVIFTAEDDRGLQAPPCAITLKVKEPRGQALATGLWAGTTVPVSLEYQTESVDQRGPGSGQNVHTTIDQPVLGLYAEGLREEGEVAFDASGGAPASVTSAYTRLDYVELFDGLVVLEGLEQEASLVWDLETQAYILESHSEIARVEVAGEEILVDVTDPVTLDLPGGGFVSLFERSEEDAPNGAFFMENMVHAYLPVGDPLSYSRHEAILGSVILRAGESQPNFPYGGQPRMLLEQDDAGSGGNAGSTPDTALPIGPGLHHGSLPPGDTVDYYEIDLEHGEKINLLLQPAARSTLTGGGLHIGEDPMGAEVIPPEPYLSPLVVFELRLFDPTGEQRESSTLALAGAPQRIELNADLDGAWHIKVARSTLGSPEAYNYTLGVTVSPVPLLPDEPMFNGAETCGDPTAPELLQGVNPKTMQHDDFVDVYRFSADIGDLVTVTLKPGETLDGWSAALTLYDENCNVLDRQDEDLLGLKGVPKLTPQLPSLYTGDYYVEVERLNGVGNYYLGLTVTDPFPYLPIWGDDDPPEDHQDAEEAPPAFFQGQFHDNNPGDAYLLPFEEGKEAFVAIKMSLASTVDVKLYRPDGTTLVPQSQNVLDGQFVLYQFEATQTGDYGLELTPTFGGGTYGVAWGQAPVELLDPDDLPLP